MRRFHKLSMLCMAASAAACSMPDVVIPTEALPYAGVRFINAVPDSAGAFGMDFRFVDIAESNAHYRIGFRNLPTSQGVSSQIEYKGAREGNRHFRIFLDDTIPSIASTVVQDGNITLVKGHNYTAMMWGYGRSTGADKMQFSFWEEDVAEPAAGKVKLRVINATNAAIDVRAYKGTSAATQTGAPTWAAVPAYTASSYVEVDTTAYMYNVRAAGGATNLFSDVRAILGAPPSCSGVTCTTGQKADIDAAPGTRVSGSAVTGIVFPASTPGSRAAQFSSPGITYMWDRRPPRTCDPYC